MASSPISRPDGTDDKSCRYWQIKWRYDDGTGVPPKLRPWHWLKVMNDGAPGALTEAWAASDYVTALKDRISMHDPRIVQGAWTNGVTPESLAERPVLKTLRDALNEYLRRPSSSNTDKCRRGAFNRVCGDEWLDRPLADITKATINGWYEKRAACVQPNTISSEFKLIFAVLRMAHLDHGWLPTPVYERKGLIFKVVTPKDRPVDQEALTKPEFKRVLGVAPTPLLRMVLLTMVGLGTRLGELLALRKMDLDLVMGRAHIVSHIVDRKWVEGTKAGARVTRSVPIGESLVEELATWCVDLAPTDYVFRQADGRHFDQEDFYEDIWPVLRTVVTQQGILPESRRFVPHTLRHTYASWMALKVEVFLLQKWMGHEDPQTTLRYYSHNDEAFEAGRKALDQIDAERALVRR